MLVCTIEDDLGGNISVRPGDMFRDTSRPYLRIAHVDNIVIGRGPIYLAACTVYVRQPDGSARRPRTQRQLVAGLTGKPYERIHPGTAEALWVQQQRIVTEVRRHGDLAAGLERILAGAEA